MKAAVIGCGRMGAQPSSRMDGTVPAGWLPISHVESLKESGRYSDIAMCDTNIESLEKWGRHHAIDTLSTDYREMVRSFRPDVVTIATRTPVKKEIIDFLCASGVKGLYVEKPLSTSIGDALTTIAAIKSAGVKLAYGVNRRYHSVYRHARKLIESGEIGDVLEIVIEHGPSQLLWTHPHSVDLILLFANVVDDDFTVQATLREGSANKVSESEIDSDPVIESAYFRFSNGIVGKIGLGMGLSVRIHGTKGSVVVHGNGTFIEVLTPEHSKSPYFLSRKVLYPESKKSASVVAMEELADAVESKANVLVNPDSIVLSIKMLMGAAWSHLNEGRRISSREIPNGFRVTGRTGDLYA